MRASNHQTGRSVDDLYPTTLTMLGSDNFLSRQMNTYAAFERATVDIVTAQLADGHRRVFMSIHLDESKATVRLKPSFDDVTEVLEKRNEIRLRRVRSQVSDVAGRLPSRSLLDDHVITLDSLGGEVVMAERGGRCQAHGSHSLLL